MREVQQSRQQRDKAGNGVGREDAKKIGIGGVVKNEVRKEVRSGVANEGEVRMGGGQTGKVGGNAKSEGENGVKSRNQWRKERRERKKVVFDMERKNVENLIMYKQSEGWYRMGGRSAIMYVMDYGLRLGKKPRLLIDKESDSRFVYGVAAFPEAGIQELFNNLRNHEIITEVKRNAKYDLYVLKLKTKFTDETYYNLLNSQKRILTEIEEKMKLKMKRVPRTVKKAEDFIGMIYEVTKNVSIVMKEALWKDLVAEAISINTALGHYEQGRISKDELKVKMEEKMVGMKIMLGLVVRTRMLAIVEIKNIVEKITELEETFRAEVGEYEEQK